MSLKPQHPIATRDRLTRNAKRTVLRDSPTTLLDRIRVPIPTGLRDGGPKAFGHLAPKDFFRAHLFRQHRARPGVKAERVFLLVNGLNEIFDWDLYYDLAQALLEAAGPKSACLLVPAPFHLDRYPGDPRAPHPIVPSSRRGTVHRPRPLDLFFEDPLEIWKMYRGQMTEISLVNELVRQTTDVDESLLSPCRDRRQLLLQAKRWFRKYIAPDAHIHGVGFSLGGLAALSAFVIDPETFDGCVLICSGAQLGAIAPLELCEREEWQNLLIALIHRMESEVSGMSDLREQRYWRAFTDVYSRSSNYAFEKVLDELKRRGSSGFRVGHRGS